MVCHEYNGTPLRVPVRVTSEGYVIISINKNKNGENVADMRADVSEDAYPAVLTPIPKKKEEPQVRYYDRKGNAISKGVFYFFQTVVDYATVKKETVRKHTISTVWTGTHQGSGTPMIFQTLVAGPDLNYIDKYATLAQAKEGHKAAVDKVRKETVSDTPISFLKVVGSLSKGFGSATIKEKIYSKVEMVLTNITNKHIVLDVDGQNIVIPPNWTMGVKGDKDHKQ